MLARSLRRSWRALPLLVAGGLLAATALAAPASATSSDFDHPGSTDTAQQTTPGNVQRQDTPNDPDYDKAEPDSTHFDPNASFDDERFDLFGFPSAKTPGATYKNGPLVGKPQVSGFNAAGAWKLERGNPSVVVAILDTGIRWDNAGLRTRVHLNTGELPLPQLASGVEAASYDANGDGVVNVDDYAADPRVNKPQPTGQDLIGVFGKCQIGADRTPVAGTCAGTDHFDNDGNGFANDIAGWDFFNNDNNPNDDSSYFAAKNHGTGRAVGAVERGNDGQGSIGLCPNCQMVPLRTYDTFVSDGNDFALGIVYATNLGASVVEGSNGSLTHTAFSEAASQYAYDHGVAQVFSGNDLNTGDHNYPANYNHTMEIQGTVPDGGAAADAEVQKIPAPIRAATGVNTAPVVSTYFRGANVTQYGGHSSISMEGSTGSENTGKASGAVALVVAAGLDGPKHLRLSPDETREILEQTAEPVTTANGAGTGVPDPGVNNPGTDSNFTSHFGWGRANVGAAVQAAWDGNLPADASIASPDWYAPLTGATAQITGRAAAPTGAPAGAAFTWKLRMGAGIAPASLTDVRSGSSTSPVTDFGTIDLAAVRTLLASTPPPPDPAGPTFAPGAHNPYQDQFSVELDVTYAGSTLPGVDRKVFTALPVDPTLRSATRLGTGGEAPPRYADINGDGVQELLVPGEDGLLRALEPNGSELPGWPFATPVQASALDHGPALVGLPPARESLRGMAVADLTGDGTQEIVTAAGTHVWALEPDGSVAPGFPVSVDPALCLGSDQHQPLHHRKCGFLASPAVGHLVKNDPSLDIVIPALDGHVYAWNAAGTLLPNYPVDLSDPNVPITSTDPQAELRQFSESITNPTLRDLNGDGVDDIIAASNEAYGGVSPGPGDVAGGPSGLFGDAFAQLGGSSRLYAVNGATGAFLPGWPVKLNGAIQSTLPFIGPGHDSATLTDNGVPVVVATTTGGVVSLYKADGTLLRGIQQENYGPASNATDRSGVFNLFEYATVGDVLGSGQPDIVKYGLSLGQIVNLAVPGQNVPYNHLIGAYDASTGAPLPAYPTITDDYQFLSSSSIAKVVSGPTSQIIAGTGLGLLHAYDGATGQDVAGFPKVTGGWLFAPAPISDDHRIAAITREGYLYEWNTDPLGPSCQTEWPTFRHDPHNSGDYNTDGTAPGAPLSLKLSGSTLSFASPGDDGYCGTPSSYVVRVDGVVTAASGPVVGGRQSATLTLGSDPAPGSQITVLARDEVGNTGPAAAVVAPAGSPPSPDASTSPSPGSTPSPSPSPSPSPTPSSSPTPGSPTSGLYHPLQPARVLDTRSSGDHIVAGTDQVLHLSGSGGVPQTGVSAVVLGVTVPLSAQAGDLQVYPVGSRPANRTSNLNWPAHRTIANLVTVPLGQGGSVALSLSQGQADAVVDVFGWYGDGSDSGGKRFTPLTPSRVLDTPALRGGADLRLQLRGQGGVPDRADITGVVATVTAVGSVGPADLQVFPSGSRPTRRTSNLNIVKGQTAAVLVDATLGSDGAIVLSLSENRARVVVDVLGYFSDSGDRYVPLSPRRVLDRKTVVAGTDEVIPLAGQNGVPADATALLLNTTGLDAPASLDLQVYPAGNRPAQRTSVLNLVRGLAVADLVSARLAGGAIALSVNRGSASVILDLEGYFRSG